MSVSATDADDPMTENAHLSYSIISQESIPAKAVTKTMFGINNETGAIYTRDVGLDREVGSTTETLWCRSQINITTTLLQQVCKAMQQIYFSFILDLFFRNVLNNFK